MLRRYLQCRGGNWLWKYVGIGKVRYLVRALMAESASHLGESDVECVAALTYQVAFRVPGFELKRSFECSNVNFNLADRLVHQDSHPT
jgi:hypothetical protein